MFYFIVIRPERARARQHQEMIKALVKGDKIVTKGGFYAEVVKTEEDFIKVKLNDDVVVKLDKDFIDRKVDGELTTQA